MQQHRFISRLDYHQIFVELDLHFVLNEANLKCKIKSLAPGFKILNPTRKCK